MNIWYVKVRCIGERPTRRNKPVIAYVHVLIEAPEADVALEMGRRYAEDNAYPFTSVLWKEFTAMETGRKSFPCFESMTKIK